MRETVATSNRDAAEVERGGWLQIVLSGQVELVDGLDVKVTGREES